MNVIRNDPTKGEPVISPIMPGPVDVSKAELDEGISKMQEILNKQPRTEIPTMMSATPPKKEEKVEEKKETKSKVQEYEIHLEGKPIGGFSTTFAYLKEAYKNLKDTGAFIFVADDGNMLYINQPKVLTITLKPKKDPLAYKKYPKQEVEVKPKKKWWKR